MPKIKIESESSSVSATTVFGPAFEASIESVEENSDDKLKVITNEEVAANLETLSSTSEDESKDENIILYYKCKIGIHTYNSMLPSSIAKNKKWEALVAFGDAYATIMGEKTNQTFSLQTHFENRIAYHQIITDDLETIVASRDPPICFVSKFKDPLHKQMGFELEDGQSLLNFRLAFHCARDRKVVWNRAVVVGGQLEIIPKVIGRGNLLDLKHGQLFFLVNEIDRLRMRVPKFQLPRTKSNPGLNESFQVVFKRTDDVLGKELDANKTNMLQEKVIDEGVQVEHVDNKEEANQTKSREDSIVARRRMSVDMTSKIERSNERSRSKNRSNNHNHKDVERQSRSKVRDNKFRGRSMKHSPNLRDKSRDSERVTNSRSKSRKKLSRDTTRSRSRSKIRNSETIKHSKRKKYRPKRSKSRKMRSNSRESGIPMRSESTQMNGEESQERGDAETIRPEPIFREIKNQNQKFDRNLEDIHEPQILQVFPVTVVPNNVRAEKLMYPPYPSEGSFSIFKNKKLSYYEFKKSLRNEVDEDEDEDEEEDVPDFNPQKDNNNNNIDKYERSIFSNKDRGRISRVLIAKEIEELKLMIANAHAAVVNQRTQTKRTIDTSEALENMSHSAWKEVKVWQKKIKDAETELNEFKKKVLDNEQKALKKVVPKQCVLEENQRLLNRIRQVEERIQTQEEEFQCLKCRGAAEEPDKFIPKVEALHQNWRKKCKLLKQLEKEKTENNLVFISVNQSISKSIQGLKEINFCAISILEQDLQDSASKKSVKIYSNTDNESAL